MAEQSKHEAPGTLLRGPDGHLYFIPDHALQPFRVPEQHEPAAEKLITPEVLATRPTLSDSTQFVAIHRHQGE